MPQLSSLDAQFLSVETPTTVGHVGTLILLDPREAPDGLLTLDRLRDVLEPRLHLAPQLRQRLLPVPLGLGRPSWVDDPDFDIEFHLREVGLPAPGNERQLADQVARIHARPLDRSRPLWEMYLLHALDNGRQALYTKVHHAAIDGISGAEILATVMDVTVEPRLVEEPTEPWDPPPLPGPVGLVGEGLRAAVRQPVEIVRTLPRALPHLVDFPGIGRFPGVRTLSAAADTVLARVTGRAPQGQAERRTFPTPPTPLNGPITAHRRFAFGSLPLDEVKQVKNAFSMTVNDVAMALCTSALRRWLLDHDGLPEQPIVVAVPVSVRTDDSADEQGNQLSVLLAQMPTHLADPAERLAEVQRSMPAAKEQFEAVPATILQDVTGVIPTALSGLAFRAFFSMAAMGAFPLNLFISNVPGPQMPLYIGGARVLGVYPASAITDITGALNITLFSYDGSLDFGLIACREMVPDVWNLIGYLRDALDELLELLPSEPAAAIP